MSEQFSINDWVNVVCGEYSPILPFRVKEAREAAAKLIEAARMHEATSFSEETGVSIISGPCLICFHEIKYKSISPMHLRCGDRWLTGITEMARRNRDERRGSIEISKRHNRPISIAGTKLSNLLPYVCHKCIEWAESSRSKYLQEEQERSRDRLKKWEENRPKERAENTEWLTSPLLPPDRRSLNDHYLKLFDFDQSTLLSMSYRAFLLSRYWALVRADVLKRNRFRCSVCASRDGFLDVHHKTYEHHGNEHNHLGDLTVLCRQCHSKFHDKLPKLPPEDQENGA